MTGCNLWEMFLTIYVFKLFDGYQDRFPLKQGCV